MNLPVATSRFELLERIAEGGGELLIVGAMRIGTRRARWALERGGLIRQTLCHDGLRVTLTSAGWGVASATREART